ncbi:T9SS type A sorting domain-containing protein [Flavobacterium sp.]|uniref:T9SS type A sorting domain-containing protein n=1 Tax=Flavobacterium sp. TaxID=239 RepID=UPI003D1210A2
MKIRLLFIFLFLKFVPSNAQNQADLEHNYGAYPGFNGNINKIVVNSSGKVLIGGDFTTYNGTIHSKIISLNDDGSLNNNIIFGTGFNNSVNDIILQPDGKILIGGLFTTYNTSNQKFLLRLNSDGSIDNSFAPNIEITSNQITNFKSILLQSDGKIIISIDYRDPNNGQIKNLLRRLNTDGSIDNDFNIDTSLVANNNNTIDIKSLALDLNNKLLVSWYLSPLFGGTVDSGLMRLNTDGSKDSSFYAQQSYNAAYVKSLADGKILLSANGDLIRLNNDGTLDPSFTIQSTLTKHIWDISSISIQQDGKYIITGKGFMNFSINGKDYNHIFRVSSTGELDNNFNVGTGFDNAVNTLALDINERPIVGGTFSTYNNQTNNKIIQLDIFGQVHLKFGSGNGFDNEINSICTQTDGKTVLTGYFDAYNNQIEKKIIKLNNDGSKDTSFNTGTGFDRAALTSYLQTDGKLIVGGGFSNYNGNSIKNLVRLNTDGTIDNSFLINKRFNGSVYTISLQNDGKILAGGFFFTNPDFYDNLKRFNTDGSLDTSFNIGSGFNNITRKIIVQNDGKLLIGGAFTLFNGSTRNRLVRLNSNGSLDTSFLIGNSFTSGTIYDIIEQTDGKIILVGDFHYSNAGVEKDYLIRLNPNGTLDNTFLFSPDYLDGLKSIALQPDGKILLGLKVYFKGTQIRIGVARLNTDGSLDTTFDNNQAFIDDFSAGADFKINDLEIQNDGKILVAGKFTNYQTQPSSSLVRLLGSNTLSQNKFDSNKISLYPIPSNEHIHLTVPETLLISSYEIYDLKGRKIKNETSIHDKLINISNLSQGSYIVKLQTSEGIFIKRIIKE